MEIDNTSTRDDLLYGLDILARFNFNMNYFQKEWNNIGLIDKKLEINYN